MHSTSGRRARSSAAGERHTAQRHADCAISSPSSAFRRGLIIAECQPPSPREFCMPQLVECIPNFSEARRPQVVDEIAASISSVTAIRLLDRSSDLDHNRSVLTFVGPLDAVEEGAFRAIEKAAQLIDLHHHTGAHPRIGATDVVPFVPLSGTTMDDCVAAARRLGSRVGEALAIPVYLYEYAATSP